MQRSIPPRSVACAVCGGQGFVKAAPLSVLPSHNGGGIRVSSGQGFHRKALWGSAVATPCWVCVGGQIT